MLGLSFYVLSLFREFFANFLPFVVVVDDF